MSASSGSTFCWLSPSDLAAAPGAPLARVLVADLRDPALRPLLQLEPSASDFADQNRPGASDRSYFLARRAALRSFVAMHLRCRGEDVRIGYDAPGAPRVHAPAACEISVSGRGPLAALAVSDAPVGVDLEILHEGVEVIADVLHESERAEIAALANADKRRQFLRIWTVKEALLKALGTGLNIDPASLAFTWRNREVDDIRRDGESVRARTSLLEKEIDGVLIVAACVVLRAHD
jgi:phosphopantetheinyl transferase